MKWLMLNLIYKLTSPIVLLFFLSWLIVGMYLHPIITDIMGGSAPPTFITWVISFIVSLFIVWMIGIIVVRGDE